MPIVSNLWQIWAKELGRDYLGCDISEKYAKLSKRRVKKAISALI